jgi:endogenous inhibitor of DNA gyrase (YacG/DUF329 family)
MPTFPCPTCQRPVEWTDAAKWRPFCSERCRLIDLGDWINEQHTIPGEPISPDALDAPAPDADPDADGPPSRH